MEIDLSNFDFSKVIPSPKLKEKNVFKWYDRRFTKLGIDDHEVRWAILRVLDKAGLLPVPLSKFNNGGYIWAPYTPLITSETINGGSPISSTGVMSRYAERTANIPAKFQFIRVK